MSVDEKYMHRCVQLAKLGIGTTGKNPLVGAVLVYNNKIIGEGYHQKYGEAHAEVNCLNSVEDTNKQLIPQATMYVNLEPCNHIGKTPPCTNAIVAAGIKKVIVGTADLNPMVAFKGIEYLRTKNIEVITNVLLQSCYKLNRVFFTNQEKKRAYIKLKWAETANGFIGLHNEQLAITNEYTNVVNHKYRTRVDGILVGYNTAINDKPQLNARHYRGNNPARIFIDPQCAIPFDILKIEGVRNIVLNNTKSTIEDGIEFIQCQLDAHSIAKTLYAHDICSVLVEGGARTHQLFINEQCWDEAIRISNNKIINQGIVAAQLNCGRLLNQRQLHGDLIRQISNSVFLK